MPTYEFICPKCRAALELFKRTVFTGEIRCDECGEQMVLKVSLIANTPELWGRP